MSINRSGGLFDKLLHEPLGGRRKLRAALLPVLHPFHVDALREIEGGIQLSLNVAARLPHLRKPPILESFLRQVYFTGVTASTGVIMRATGLGVIIIAVMMNMLDADVDLAVKILLLLVFRE